MTWRASRPQAATRVPGVRDFWTLIAAECGLFSFFFITYMIGRNGDLDLYRASQQALSRKLGGFNTLILILGSWAVMRALNCARHDRGQVAARWLAGAAGCGMTFLCVKIVEYSDKFAHGLFPTTNDFFTFYFVMTMIHLVHLIIGTIVLLAMRRGVAQGVYNRDNMEVLESAAIYWHLVDLLWIFLFALFYLLR